MVLGEGDEGWLLVPEEKGLGWASGVPPGTSILKPYLWASESCSVKVSPSVK